MLQNYEKIISNTQSVVAMERCLTDLACSMKVMRSFANSDLVSDCDGDGLMNCDDFAMAHHLGEIGCKEPAKRAAYKNSRLYERYKACKNSVLATGQEIDLPK